MSDGDVSRRRGRSRRRSRGRGRGGVEYCIDRLDTAALGTSKSRSLAARCRSINDGVDVIEHETYATNVNADALIESYDVVCDCSDNPRTRRARGRVRARGRR